MVLWPNFYGNPPQIEVGKQAKWCCIWTSIDKVQNQISNKLVWMNFAGICSVILRHVHFSTHHLPRCFCSYPDSSFVSSLLVSADPIFTLLVVFRRGQSWFNWRLLRLFDDATRLRHRRWWAAGPSLGIQQAPRWHHGHPNIDGGFVKGLFSKNNRRTIGAHWHSKSQISCRN